MSGGLRDGGRVRPTMYKRIALITVVFVMQKMLLRDNACSQIAW